MTVASEEDPIAHRGELGHVDTDQVAVIVGGQIQVRGHDGLLDALDGRLVIRLDDKQAGLGS